MSDKKHIDRLFQEKFKNFEVTPDDAVWDNIHQALHKEKRKRSVIPIWWKLGGIAAILALLFTVGNAVFNNPQSIINPENSVVGTENSQDGLKTKPTDPVDNSDKAINTTKNSTTSGQTEKTDENTSTSNATHSVKTQPKTAIKIANETPKTKDNGDARSIEKASQNENILTTKAQKGVVAKNTPNLPPSNADETIALEGSENTKVVINSERNASQIAQTRNQNAINGAEAPIAIKDDSTVNTKDNSIEEAIAKANPTIEEEKEEQSNRWNITPNVAPVYFNTLGKGSSIDGQFVNNSKSGDVHMSYGISGSYALNTKLKLRAGLNKVNLGYSTNGVIAYNERANFDGASSYAQIQNINFKNQNVSNGFLSTSDLNIQSAPQALFANTKGALEQQFGYIEIPLELEYAILNTKFGLNVIGGFSTLFLNNNEIFSVLENERSLVGEANNINSTSYSANFGLGFNYNLSQRLKLNLEPMFKYQINTFNKTSGDFRPYYIGVYTGFSFKF